MADQKDTIYIDVDDEITAIIGKVEDSSAKIVALVLPKRASSLQSIVNMKLLKRTADDAGKHIVLITSEAGLLPLAGAVGVYAAKNLQSKPEIPAAPLKINEPDDEAVDIDDVSPEAAAVGGLAVDDTIEIDDGVKGQAKAKTKKPSKKGPKIPNFEKFRVKLFLIIGGVIALIAFWYLAVFVMPSAKIVITTDSEDINTSVQFTASTTAASVSVGDKIIPAELAETDKEEAQKTAATGQKDLGAKATGSVTMYISCDDVDGTPPTVPSGTAVSAEGLTFITQSSVSVTTPDFNDGACFSGTTTVSAQNKGEQYNIGAASYSISGYSELTGSGTAMTGGSSKIAKVVSEEDVDTAKGKMSISDDSVKAELKSQLEEQGKYAIVDSFEKSDEKTTVSPKVGEEASEVSVTYSATYTMLGINRDDLKQILSDSIKDQIDPERQQIQDDGLDQATFDIKSSKSDGTAVIAVSTIVEVGPNIDVEKLKTDISGQKHGEAENTIRALPGVNDVTVDYNPFWVNKAPKNTEKITVEFKQAE